MQTTSLRIQGVSGVHAGVTFQITRDEILIGSDTSCRLNYPVNTPGIDGFQSKLLVKDGNLYLAALSNQNGTWLNGAQCTLSKGYLLREENRNKVACYATKRNGSMIFYICRYCDFPSEHWTRIRTNNAIERLNREIRKRTQVVGSFPDGNSALMLVCARLRHVASSQWGSKKYMSMKHLEMYEVQVG